MTNEQLDAKYSQLTGLRFKVSDIIANAGESSQKLEAAYNYLMWNIKNGQIRQVDGIKELVEEIVPALQSVCGQQSSAEPSEQEVYTAAEAIAYNAALAGAVKAGDIKTTEVESSSYDYIYDKDSWDASFANGGLKMYYIWSDAANAPYKEDLWNTVEERAANINDARKEDDEYVLDDNGNYIYDNCERSWQGAVNAPGAKYPWIVPHFDTDVNAKITFKYEGKEDVQPWGDKLFGIGKKDDGTDRLFGCASIPNELGEEFLLNEGVTTFDISKFKMFLVTEEAYTEETAAAYNATLEGAVKAGDPKQNA